MGGAGAVPSSSLGRQERKEALRRALLARDWAGLSGLSLPPALVLRTLTGFLQSDQPLLRWRAVEAFGTAAAGAGAGESAREVVKSLFWGMNDESGNLCRMAPEAIGAILAAREELRDEFAHLLPQFLVEEPFEEGTLWALGHLVRCGWEPPMRLERAARALAGHPSARRRGLALRLARLLGQPLERGGPEQAAEFEDYDLSSGELAWVREPPDPPPQV